MAELSLSIKLSVDDNDVEKIKRLENHADWLLDLESWPEIKKIYGCKVEEVPKTVSSTFIHNNGTLNIQF